MGSSPCLRFLAAGAVLCGVLQSGAAWARSADVQKFAQAHQYCEGKTCYASNPYGGWGLEPKRTYRLVYDGGPVCSVVRDALNRAIERGAEAEKDVTFPVPRYREYETKGDRDLVVDSRGNPFVYVSQNPLYSDPIFLRWNYLGGYPNTDITTLGGATSDIKWIIGMIMM